MTNEKALKALQQIKTYCAATQLEELNYVIEVPTGLTITANGVPVTKEYLISEHKKAVRSDTAYLSSYNKELASLNEQYKKEILEIIPDFQ